MKGNVDLTVDRKFMFNPDKKEAKHEWKSDEARREKNIPTSTTVDGSIWTSAGMGFDQTNTTFSNSSLSMSSNDFDTGIGTYVFGEPSIHVEGRRIGLRDMVSGGKQSPFPWAPKTFYDWMLEKFIYGFEPILLGNKEERSYKKYQLKFQKKENVCNICYGPLKTWDHNNTCSKCQEESTLRSNSKKSWWVATARERFMSFKEKPPKYLKGFDDKPSLQYSSSFRRRRTNMMDLEVV